ncbi:cofactor assembly of complex C subunit B [Anthocerotibacter panamensis]|uniref:cofactor assembly of complex C subunit B n=1 Tax=Anthocerotibacter panamensis TaxID=2857077 RepID=UPI001C4028E2|nr:cofactor assembly of complex C subunit B [Anthocerotibacter panamensis]
MECGLAPRPSDVDTVVTEIAFYSTLALTLLIAVGLFFFIRASVKDRTKQETFLSEVAPETLDTRLAHYFQRRAYRLVDSGAVRVYEGIVQPSRFLAVFLSVLALCGLGSVALVLAVLVPVLGGWWFLLVVLSPLAGAFYWRRALRPERVLLQLISGEQVTQIHVKAHRDELEKFKAALGFES